jgi:hypothetical protein
MKSVSSAFTAKWLERGQATFPTVMRFDYCNIKCFIVQMVEVSEEVTGSAGESYNP